VGAAAVVAGLIWHFAEKPKSRPPAPATGVHLQPIVTPGYAGISLGGGFN
jgi:hypothetical protein